MSTDPIKFADLPPLLQPLAGGTFAGVATKPDSTHCAIVLLPDHGEDLTHPNAIAWAEALGAELPTRAIAALLFANAKALLRPQWHWCLETSGASCAWYCYFDNGYQYDTRKSFEGSAVAVRSISLIA